MKRNGKQNAELTEMAFWTHKFKNPLFLNKAGDTEARSLVEYAEANSPIYPYTYQKPISLSLPSLCLSRSLYQFFWFSENGIGPR